MIRAHFLEEKGKPVGFEISGHSLFSESGTDIVCAAVSSAAILVANTLTENFGIEAEVKTQEGLLFFKTEPNETTQGILSGLKLHLEQLAEQYPQNITVS